MLTVSGDEGAKRFDRCGGRELGTCNPRIEHEHRQLIWRDVQRSSAGGIEKAKHSDREKQCEEEVAKGATSTGAATAAGIITTLASLSAPWLSPSANDERGAASTKTSKVLAFWFVAPRLVFCRFAPFGSFA